MAAIYHQLVDTYESTDSNAEEVDISLPGPSNSRAVRVLPNRCLRKAVDWKHEARALLELLWHCEDSAPFRVPVDPLKHTGIKLNETIIYCQVLQLVRNLCAII